MKCKYCFAELDENISVCPVCGKSLTEPVEEETPAAEEIVETPAEETAETPAEETAEAPAEETAEAPAEEIPEAVVPAGKKKLKIWQITLLIAGGVLLLAILAGAVLYGLGINILPRSNDVSYKTSYTVEDETVEKKANTVVATLGDFRLTVADLQVYYRMAISDFVDYYSSYMSQIGLDIQKPLDKQYVNMNTGETFQQMFIESALSNWCSYATMAQLAKENDFTLSEEDQAVLDAFESQMKEMATEYGYDDVDTFISEAMIPGSNFEAMSAYNALSYTGTAYYDSLYEAMLPSEQEMEDYYKENEQALVAGGMGKDAGKYYDVRHILIKPEGGTADENGTVTYTDDEWEACRAAAQALLDDYLAGEATEESFAALAMEKSQDPGSSSEGGFYGQLTKDTNFVQEFKDWYMDESRAPGDTGLVRSVHGYHIMYFTTSIPIWEYEVKTTILTDNTNKLLDDAEARYPMKVNYKKIVVSELG